jgi:hypothetical protein
MINFKFHINQFKSYLKKLNANILQDGPERIYNEHGKKYINRPDVIITTV